MERRSCTLITSVIIKNRYGFSRRFGACASRLYDPAALGACGADAAYRKRKIDRSALPIPENKPAKRQNIILPRNLVEEELANIWKQVLGVNTISIDDDFFAIGGHSLKALQVIHTLKHQQNIDIPIDFLFEHPTIAQLAENFILNS